MQGTWRKKSGESGDEIVLSDILGFFRANWKLIGLLTLLFSALAIGLALLLPDQYNKRVTLAVRPVPSDLQTSLNQPPVMTPKQAGDLAVAYIQNADLGGVDASPTYNNVTQWVEVALQSRDRDALNGVAPVLVEAVENGFSTNYEAAFRAAVETEVTQLRRGLENQREILEDLDNQIEQSGPVQTGGTEDVAAIVRLQALETERADQNAAIAADENRLAYLEEALRDLPQRARDATSVEVLEESGTPQSRSLVPLMILAVLSSLVLAVIVAIVRTAVRGTK
ncbi:Wzz/FepE/Etk N-terminal domain-containing protein [Rubrobacter marinus]|uniref:Wzz/FepE/Etk N-terminal domain-containing protein n=1 Tax=Rubrobacter marinus TaxID=2653852 RepID=UPI00140956E8|nr:Wzz/FepE/Etk N-terminal domain-containing protein [Rubrobacter marinus]